MAIYIELTFYTLIFRVQYIFLGFISCCSICC